MTYQELKDAIEELTDEQLMMNVSVAIVKASTMKMTGKIDDLDYLVEGNVPLLVIYE